jgi:hypothetical protein
MIRLTVLSALTAVVTACGDPSGARLAAPRSLGDLQGEWSFTVSEIGRWQCTMSDVTLRFTVRDSVVTARFLPAARNSAEVALLMKRFEREGSAPGMNSCPALDHHNVVLAPSDLPDELAGVVHGDSVRLSRRWAMAPGVLAHAEFDLVRSGSTLSGTASFRFAAAGQPVSHGRVLARRR